MDWEEYKEKFGDFADNKMEGTMLGEAYDTFTAAEDAYNAGKNAMNNGLSRADAVKVAQNQFQSSTQADNNANTRKLIGGSDVGISELTEGISHNGMEKYLEELKAEVLTKTINVINDNAPDLEAAINKGWQGKARDKFFESFNKVRGDIAADLTEEYYDLVARLQELEDNYFAQDSKMLEFME